MAALPPQVLSARRRACEACLARCALYRAPAVSDPARGCPHPAGARWLPYQTVGAGTAFAVVAQPIAKAADAVLGTNLVGCGGCAGRKQRWDRAVPDVLHPWRRS